MAEWMSIYKYPQCGFVQTRGGNVEWALVLPSPSCGALTGSLPVSPRLACVTSEQGYDVPAGL